MEFKSSVRAVPDNLRVVEALPAFVVVAIWFVEPVLVLGKSVP